MRKSNSFGEIIRDLRENKNLLQRQLAARLEIDTPMYSKIERGERKAKREQVFLIAELLEIDSNYLLKIWKADQILNLLHNEPFAHDILEVVNQSIKKYE